MPVMHTKADIAEYLRAMCAQYAKDHAMVGTFENDAIAAVYRELESACERVRDGARSLSYLLAYCEELHNASKRNAKLADTESRHRATGQRLAASTLEQSFKLAIDWLP